MSVNLKGQSAIEYLFTYGWMLVAVSIAGGAAYSTIGFECVESTTGFTGTDVSVEDFGVSTSEELDLVLQNNAANPINVTEASVSLEDGGQVVNLSGFELSQQERRPWTIGSGFRSSPDHCNTFNVRIVYDIGPLSNQVTTGRITASMDVSASPDAPRNLEVQQAES